MVNQKTSPNVLAQLFLTFLKIGSFTFGGGYAMIALIDHECVEHHGWISSDELSDMTAVAETTPGPIAINSATFVGRKLAGIPGALLATLGVALPSFIIVLVIAAFFEAAMALPLVAKAFGGIRVAVALLIIQAATKMIGKLMKTKENRSIHIAMIAAFFSIVLITNLLGGHVFTIGMIAASGLIGYLLFGREKCA